MSGAQTFRSTATDGDPTMLNGVERGGSNSAVDVIPVVNGSNNGLMSPTMLNNLNDCVNKVLQIISEDHSIVRNIFCKDTRDDIIDPSSLYPMLRVDFKGKSVVGLGDNYSGILSFRPYGRESDWTGGPAHQLAFNTAGVYHRNNLNDSSWNGWRKLWLDGDRITNAVWNDYAELFERGSKTEPGDLISLDVLSDKECYILASKTNNRVVGVHSDEYGFLIGGDKQPDTEDFLQYNLPKFIPVGLCGRCHVKVIGTCKKGDYLVPSNIPGVAEVYNEKVDNILTIFGIACENKTSEDIGKVRVYLKS